MDKIWIGLSILGLVAVLALGVAAYPGIGFGKGIGKDMNQTGVSDEQKQFRNDVQEAIANNDYDAWRSLMESELTQENFNRLVEQHKNMAQMQELREQLRQAVQDKDTEKIDELRQQMSNLMPEGANGPLSGKMRGFGKGGCMH